MATGAIHSCEPTSYPVPEATGAFIDVCSLDNFEIGEEIGSGAFGKVVKAKHEKYNDVAIKILRCEGSRDDQGVRKEATKMRQLCAYPSIMCVHCVTQCSDQNRFGIVMEWMKLGNLKDFQQKLNKLFLLKDLQQKQINEFPWALRMRMLKEISEGMYYLHDAGIIHGDLKAENIFVQETLSVKIGDFGLSKSMQSAKGCKPGGTPSHMPPEFFNGTQHQNKKWDVYSFGILLYEVASGKTAFEAIGSDVDRLMYCVGKNDERPQICCSYPAFYQKLMRKCWDRIPASRPDFKEIKMKIRRAYEMDYETSILEAIIEVLTLLKDQQCVTETDSKMSNLQKTFRGMQIENQGGSTELVTGNEANKEIATSNQVSDDQSDKFQQTASYVNTAVPQSTGRPIPANSSIESHSEIKSVPMSPRQPVSANSSTESHLEITNGDKILTNEDKQCLADCLTRDNFKTLGKRFGLKPGQISCIETDNKYHNDQVYALVHKWEGKNGKRTRRHLSECLWDVDRTIIEELNKL